LHIHYGLVKRDLHSAVKAAMVTHSRSAGTSEPIMHVIIIIIIHIALKGSWSAHNHCISWKAL